MDARAARAARSGGSRRRSRDLERGAAIAERTGRERVLLMLTRRGGATLIELGRLADAARPPSEGLERARLSGNPRMLLWAHCALARRRAGATATSRRALREPARRPRTGAEPDVHAAGQPGWCLGAALAAAGERRRGRACRR